MFDEKMLDGLRTDVCASMSEKRFRHTAEVEKMAARLGALYLPGKIDVLRAAALLHDITKEYTTEKQVEVFEAFGITVTKQDILTPKTFHARTAALLIPALYPAFADDEVITAVRYHTTGRQGMTMAEKLIYLADYIDESRTFDDCVKLRTLFFEAEPEKMDGEARAEHLRKILITSFDMTITGLLADGAAISDDTFRARNSLIVDR